MGFPELSIVLGHLDRPEAFYRLFDSVRAYTQGISWEMVVSEASYNRFIDPNKLSGENVTIIKESPRLGHCKGYNEAFRTCRGRWVAWLNDDCEVSPNWASEAIGFMERNPWVGMGALYYCINYEPFYINDYWGMPYSNFGIIDRIYGDSLGWFDECVEMYGADNSLSFKVYLSGKAVRGIPASKIIHRPFMDEHRLVNESKQPRDCEILGNKYQHLTDTMLRVHRKFPLIGV